MLQINWIEAVPFEKLKTNRTDEQICVRADGYFLKSSIVVLGAVASSPIYFHGLLDNMRCSRTAV